MFSLATALQVLSFSAILNAGSAIASFESVYELPRGWRLMRPAEGTEDIRLRISLMQQNVDKLYDILMDVSTPSHPKYGQHLQGEEVFELLKPRKETSDAVISWLQDSNITSIKDDSDWIMFSTNVKTANKLLETQFQWYLDEASNTEVLRTMEYSIPKTLESHINFVQPTTRFGSLKQFRTTVEEAPEMANEPQFGTALSATGIDVACNVSITPTCLREIYNIHYKGDPSVGNKAGYGSFLEESARYTDLALFEAAYAPEAIGENFTVSSVFNFQKHVLTEFRLSP
jgi:tripeptidyl-peptidase-1